PREASRQHQIRLELQDLFRISADRRQTLGPVGIERHVRIARIIRESKDLLPIRQRQEELISARIDGHDPPRSGVCRGQIKAGHRTYCGEGTPNPPGYRSSHNRALFALARADTVPTALRHISWQAPLLGGTDLDEVCVMLRFAYSATCAGVLVSLPIVVSEASAQQQ